MNAAGVSLVCSSPCWRAPSGRGNRYLTGWLAKARIVAFPGDPDAQGNPTWNLYLASRPRARIDRQRVVTTPGATAMLDEPRKSATKPRGRPFPPNNPGKPKGTRHRTTMAAEALLDGEAEALTRRCVELALEGDTTALRLCLERILPPRKERPVKVTLPDLAGTDGIVSATRSVIEQVASGALAPGEGTDIVRLLDAHLRAVEANQLETRIDALEKRVGGPQRRPA